MNRPFDIETNLLDEETRAKAWANRDVGIEYQGRAITLPDDPNKMPLRTAIDALERKAADEEQQHSVYEIIDAYPDDALVAFNEAMRVLYGWASPVPKPGFFGPTPPQTITIATGPGPNDKVQVVTGEFKLPGVSGRVGVTRTMSDGQPVLVIYGEIKKRDAHIVMELCAKTREILKKQSIYKGRAIRLRTDDNGNLNPNLGPLFIPTAHIREEELILNPDEWNLVRVALWAPIRNTADCLKHNIPLNRGILLEGIYGTGKTMTASVTSKICTDHGWTYVLLDDVRALKDALLFAQRYAPAVVFAEDADRVAHVRDQRGNDLLNTIDGVLTKNSQVITVLTTNHVDKLDRAMLRPGRLDAVITIKAPGVESVERLMRIYGRGLIDPKAKLTPAAKALAGNIPATIREVVERSKLAMIANGNEKVTGDDLLISAHGMASHLELLKEKPVEQSLEERLGSTMIEVVSKAIDPNTEQGLSIHNMVDKLCEYHDIEV